MSRYHSHTGANGTQEVFGHAIPDRYSEHTQRLHANPIDGQPRFETIADSLSSTAADIRNAIDRTRSIADRYGGPVPEPISKDNNPETPNSLVARMENSVGLLTVLLGQLHAQIDRLERF